MATDVHLTPELDRFAKACVESGQYNNVSEAVLAALRLLLDEAIAAVEAAPESARATPS